MILVICLIKIIPYYSAYPTNKNTFNPDNGSLNALSTVKERIGFLNKKTPVNLIYNSDVQKYIDLYLGDRYSELEKMIARSKIYFPIIESFLDKYNLPLELKYAAVLESGLNLCARSRSGAVGPWQFLYNTCDLVDLEVNSYIDERRDIFKSTNAACRYLKYLFQIYNDWDLALASYNDGPGEISKAIERSGGETNYWKLQPYLSKQASQYIPAFIAFNYLFEFQKELNIKIKSDGITLAGIDTVYVHKPISFEQISENIKIPLVNLKLLNPTYLKDYIPVVSDPSILILPKDKIMTFIRFENKIYNSVHSVLNYHDVRKTSGSTNKRTCITHVVRKGEFFHKIAMNYNCTIESIKIWNSLESNVLYPGQKIKIWIDNNNR